MGSLRVEYFAGFYTAGRERGISGQHEQHLSYKLGPHMPVEATSVDLNLKHFLEGILPDPSVTKLLYETLI